MLGAIVMAINMCVCNEFVTICHEFVNIYEMNTCVGQDLGTPRFGRLARNLARLQYLLWSTVVTYHVYTYMSQRKEMIGVEYCKTGMGFSF